MLETLKTINLDAVPEMFAIAGIKPVRSLMCACIMSAALHPKAFGCIDDAVKEGFDKKYVAGVMDGWDEHTDGTPWDVDVSSIEYKLGWAHGEAARLIMMPRGLVD